MFLYFWYRERERERESMSRGGAERGQHRIQSRLQALSCQHRAQRGAQTHKPWDHDLSQSLMLNQLSHPGTPIFPLFSKNMWAPWIGRNVPCTINYFYPECMDGAIACRGLAWTEFAYLDTKRKISDHVRAYLIGEDGRRRWCWRWFCQGFRFCTIT